MASWREVARPLRQLTTSQISRQAKPVCGRRWSSAEAAAAAPPPTESPAYQDLEPGSTQAIPGPAPEQIEEFGVPWRRSAERTQQLPASRYQYHPPKFLRGPLHPIQAPPSSDPIARDFVPGPFYYPRLKETWANTVAPDLMCLAYKHQEPGYKPEPVGQRLRSWDDSSPYHKNRPLRGPRGGDTLRPLEKDISHHNVPELLAVSLSAYTPMAIKEPTYLLAARAALQSISGSRTEIIRVRKGVAQFGIQKGAPAGCKVTLWSDQAYEFMDKMVHLVLPRIKEWRGVPFHTGDESGNVGWGFRPEEVALFPEIEHNYDAFPPKMVPGIRVMVQTTARSDRHARLLMQALGIPFYTPSKHEK